MPAATLSENDQAIVTSPVRVLHVSSRENENGQPEFWNGDSIIPAQPENIRGAKTGVDLEERHPSEMVWQFREQAVLLISADRVGDYGCWATT